MVVGQLFCESMVGGGGAITIFCVSMVGGGGAIISTKLNRISLLQDISMLAWIRMNAISSENLS